MLNKDLLTNILIQKGLTNKQAAVAVLAATGLSNREIGADRGITEKGVKYHMTSIKKRLCVHSRAQLIVTCLGWAEYKC